ncbi:uncharacterized protein D806_0078-like [Pollicipes pollicipes]|uniref:uncharacterized protein D806_0078-like n=1 Tax=Pollicipes pollicipes TaxID=41117 RepID=UPI001884F72F|nr:uncharacterized protein D806_0078-like [Pollicipes pollicipes]
MSVQSCFEMSDENRPEAASQRRTAPYPAGLKLAAVADRPVLKETNRGPNAQSGAPSRYDAVRALDEDENWRDRTEVITKQDHTLNKQLARDIVEQIVDSAASTPSEDSSQSFATVSSNPPAPPLPTSASLPDVVRGVADPRAADSGDSGLPPAVRPMPAAAEARSAQRTEYESAPEQEDEPGPPTIRSEASLLADQLLGLALQTPLKRAPAAQAGDQSCADSAPQSPPSSPSPFGRGSPPIRTAAAAAMTQTGDEDEPIPPKVGYNLDFLDDPSFNPFATGSGIRLSPPASPSPALPPLKAARTKKQREPV